MSRFFRCLSAGPARRRKRERRPPIYDGGRRGKRLLRGLLLALAALALLAVILFFLLRSWAIYDAAGAHIVPPWRRTSTEPAPLSTQRAKAPVFSCPRGGGAVNNGEADLKKDVFRLVRKTQPEK